MPEESTLAVEELEAELEAVQVEEAAAEEEVVAVVPEVVAEPRGKKFKAAVEVEAAELQEVVEVVVPTPPAAIAPAASRGGMSISIRNRQ